MEKIQYIKPDVEMLPVEGIHLMAGTNTPPSDQPVTDEPGTGPVWTSPEDEDALDGKGSGFWDNGE